MLEDDFDGSTSAFALFSADFMAFALTPEGAATVTAVQGPFVLPAMYYAFECMEPVIVSGPTTAQQNARTVRPLKTPSRFSMSTFKNPSLVSFFQREAMVF